jgi:hypothetical protein
MCGSCAGRHESARDLARCYLPDTVRLLAGIALVADSEAVLHTRMTAAKDSGAIAGVIQQATPSRLTLADERPTNSGERS